MSSDDWCTPQCVIDLVHEFWIGGPDLDPCSTEHSTVSAQWDISPPDDGLEAVWSGLRVWLNPPYSDPAPWVARAVAHDGEVLLLLKLDPSTRWWQLLWTRDLSLCLPYKRLKFESQGEPSTTAPFPSALVYLGGRNDSFGRVFGALGKCTRIEAP